jgi:hypothetical protein
MDCRIAQEWDASKQKSNGFTISFPVPIGIPIPSWVIYRFRTKQKKDRVGYIK